jgi:hypothetical protein
MNKKNERLLKNGVQDLEQIYTGCPPKKKDESISLLFIGEF